ncbi:hypothetical protein [Halococcus sediminicola]|uniref:hypothetical protein n=1 Tax=Halococcus sediminicola TaxID=1264579 RepID=UPI0006787FDF|nr:hypothetical protein [Halococcus sediminicola]
MTGSGSNPEPGIAVTGQYPAEADVVVRPGENSTWAPTKLHRELFDTDGSQLADRLYESVRAIGRQAASIEKLYAILERNDVDALDGGYADLAVEIAKGRDGLRHELVRTTRQLGGQTSHDVRTSLEDIDSGDPALFAAAQSVTPTIAISLDGFTSVRSDQRQAVLALVRAYARGCRVVLVASPIERTFLWRKHREELPASVKDDCKPRLGEQAMPAAVESRVEDAREAFDPDSKPIAILRAIADETSETTTYSALADAMNVGRGTIRNHVSQRLVPHALVERFDHRGTTHVSLSHVGREFLAALDSEIGVQSQLDDCVNATGNLSDDSRVTPPAHEGRHRPSAEAEEEAVAESDGAGTDADRNRLPFSHQVRSAARHRYAAAAGCASEGAMTLCDYPIAEKSDRGEPHHYYDHEADRLLVGAEYDNPMQWWVCIALALTSTRTFRHALTHERFESGKLGDLLANHTDLLRDLRCLGYLKDVDATPEAYTEALIEAAEDLRKLTKHYRDGNYENESRFRGEITREALGLAGTMVHLLDLADIDVVREARIPRYSKDFKADQKADLAKTLCIGASIQSRYGEFAAHRQLFELRKQKRESTFSPTVDADDPFGELIGSFVLVGKSVESIADRLRRRLSNWEPHDDAPEFAIRVSVETATERRHTAATMTVACRQKNLRSTRTAISLFAALAGTPYDVARAVHSLESETKAPNREIRLDEVRFALSTLTAERILPEMSKPALSRTIHTLLVAESPLIQSELADRADVSARWIRKHIERLAAFDFIRQTDGGWRFALPFHTDEERGKTIYPWFVSSSEADREQDTLVREVVAEAVYDLLDAGQYANADDPVGGLFAKPGERIPALQEAWEWLDPWISAVEILVDADSSRVSAANKSPFYRTDSIAVIGAETDQVSIVAAARGDR